MTRPLEGLTVLDLTWVLSGPFATMLLADLGAEVIKVERPPYGDVARTTGPYQNGYSAYFFSINRGKKSISINLASAEGREVFLRLVEQADLVVENFTPGTLDRLKIGYDVLAERNPAVILASISGFGQTGPYRNRPALDIIVQAMGGVMSITGETGGGPVRPGTSYGDITAGLFTTVAILAALHEREQSGRGQAIDISMLDCQVTVLENAIARYFVTGQPPARLGTRHPSATPFQAFPTSDGYLVVALGFGEENQWQLLCGTLGLTQLIGDERYETSAKRTARHAELEPLMTGAFRQRTTAEWLEELLALGIPCGPVNGIPEVVADPQIEHRAMVREVAHPRAGAIRTANTPFRFSRSEAGMTGAPPPDVGEHTATVLVERLGIDPAELARLVAGGIVATEGGPDISAIAP